MQTITITTYREGSAFTRDGKSLTAKSLKSDCVIRFNGKRFGLGAVPEDASGRKIDQGPLVPGPWAYAFPLASVIDNHGGSGAESERLRQEGMEFDAEEGDAVIIDGQTYIAQPEGFYRYLDLVPQAIAERRAQQAALLADSSEPDLRWFYGEMAKRAQSGLSAAADREREVAIENLQLVRAEAKKRGIKL